MATEWSPCRKQHKKIISILGYIDRYYFYYGILMAASAFSSCYRLFMGTIYKYISRLGCNILMSDIWNWCTGGDMADSNMSVITREKVYQKTHVQSWIDADNSLLHAGETLSAQNVPCVLPEWSVESVLCLDYHHASRHKTHLPLNCTFTGFMLTLARGPLCLARSSACRWQKSLGSL